LQAADLGTGAEKWRFKTPGAIFGAPSIAGDVVLIDVMPGALFAVDKRTGKELWHLTIADRTFSSPVISNGIVYTAGDAGILYALDTSGQAIPTIKAKKYVYYQGKKSSDDFPWFRDDVSAANLAYFKAMGYEQLDEAGLIKTMNDQLRDDQCNVIVFADDLVPKSAAHADSGETLIRRYVEAGGRAAFLGASPLALVRDATGAVTDIDYDLAGKMIGVHYPPRQRDWGYHVSAPTPEGVKWGLRNLDVARDVIDPKDATVVLELDEFGMATSWAKSYGQKGGMVLQLNIPATAQTDLTPYRLAIEHGLN
jgi:YD repeat-containing protein